MNDKRPLTLVHGWRRLGGRFCVVIALAGCGSGGGDEAPAPSGTSPPSIAAVVTNTSHLEVVFDASRARLYAAGFSRAVTADPTLIVIDAQTGASRELPARPNMRWGTTYRPGLISLSSSGRFLYFINESHQVARFNLNNEVVDFIVPPPSSWGPNARVERIVASPIDDLTVYAELSGVNSGGVSLGAVTDQSWMPRRLDIAAASSLTAPAVNLQASELLVTLSDGRFRRVRVLSDGIGEVIAEVPNGFPSFLFTAKPAYLTDGILLGFNVYDSMTLAYRVSIPSASHCTALGTGARLACYGFSSQGAYRLFVYDRVATQRVSEWSAIPPTETPVAITAGAGKVAVSYQGFSRLGGLFPSHIAIYSDPAFN